MSGDELTIGGSDYTIEVSDDCVTIYEGGTGSTAVAHVSFEHDDEGSVAWTLDSDAVGEVTERRTELADGVGVWKTRPVDGSAYPVVADGQAAYALVPDSTGRGTRSRIKRQYPVFGDDIGVVGVPVAGQRDEAQSADGDRSGDGSAEQAGGDEETEPEPSSRREHLRRTGQT